jgi:hypothetical protein
MTSSPKSDVRPPFSLRIRGLSVSALSLLFALEVRCSTKTTLAPSLGIC